MTTYYTVGGVPVSHSFGTSAPIRSEYILIQTAFATVNAEMVLKGAISGQTWTGNHTFTGGTITVPTQTLGDNTTYAASTAFVFAGLALKANINSPTFTGTVTIPSGASIAGFAPLASPALTGVPTAPTAAGGTATTQIATTEFVTSTAFNVNLPGQTGNAGKFVTTNGTTASWAFAGIASVTTATTATTLTSTPTLLQITPASYGVTVTLPDATTCSEGGPLHAIDNRGAYPVRVCDSTGTLKGFIFAGVVSYISLDDNSTAAGIWAISSNELVGASAQLLTTNLSQILTSIDLGSNQELILGAGVSNANAYGVVYNRATNTFGSVTLIRTATISVVGGYSACLSGANQVLVVTVPNGAATFEAVTLSISGTTITVNAAATATLSANINAFADGCGLIAVGSSFVTSYTVATPAAQIRALSISGTTVTIGSATVLDGTAGGIQHASGSVVVVASTSNAVANVFTKPYTVSGSTLSAGTGTSTAKQNSAHTLQFFAPFSSGRWMIACGSSGNGADAGVVTLTGTTTTISYLTNFYAGGQTHLDAIIVGANKVLFLGNSSASNANMLTDTGGTASAGTAITLDAETARACLYVDSTNVAVSSGSGGANIFTTMVDCSGASPVKTKAYKMSSAGDVPVFSASNSVLSKAVTSLTGTAFAQRLLLTITASNASHQWRVRGGEALRVPAINPIFTGTAYRGKAESERWVADAATLITKFECVA